MSKAAQNLLKRIADHCQTIGMSEATFGLKAVNDGKLVSRLRAGGTVTLRTMEAIEAALEKAEANP